MSSSFWRKFSLLDFLVVIALPVTIAGIWYIWGGHETLDDAYITFRYAHHFVDGFGFVWNIGGEPTQGSTSLGFTLAMALGIKLNADVVFFAFILNTLGLILIAASVRVAAYYIVNDRIWSLVPSALITLSALSLQNVLSGMETVFWTGLVFCTALSILLFVKTRRISLLWIIVVLSLAIAITRPESLMFVGVWFLLLFSLEYMQGMHYGQFTTLVTICRIRFILK